MLQGQGSPRVLDYWGSVGLFSIGNHFLRQGICGNVWEHFGFLQPVGAADTQ